MNYYQITANEIEANEEASGSVIQPTTNRTTNGVGNNLPQTGVTEDITVAFFETDQKNIFDGQ